MYKPYDDATEPLFLKPRETRLLKREKPFITGREANLERTIGENNEGVSLHVAIEVKPECVEQWWEEWKKIFPPVVAEPVCRLPPLPPSSVSREHRTRPTDPSRHRSVCTSKSSPTPRTRAS